MAYPFTDGQTETHSNSLSEAHWSLGGPSHETSESGGVIGPNSVTQLEAACDQILGRDETIYLFTAAGLYCYIEMPPIKMVSEEHPARLFATLYRIYPKDTADTVAKLAGELTADYVIENRIPKLAVQVLRWMPAKLAGVGLLKAIQKNSWTFAGSGVCMTGTDGTPHLNIHDNPLRMPGAAWHLGVFEQMFRRLVCAHATVEFAELGLTSNFDLRYGLPQIKTTCPYVQAGHAPFMCVNCTKSEAIH